MGWLGTEGRGKGGACVVCGQGWRERTVWQARPTTQRGALLGDMPGDCLVLNTCGVCVCVLLLLLLLQALHRYSELLLLLTGRRPSELLPPTPPSYTVNRVWQLAHSTCVKDFNWVRQRGCGVGLSWFCLKEGGQGA